jgi:hypothetical protein
MPKKHRYARHSTLPRSLRGKALDMLPKKMPAIAPEAEDWAAVKAEFPGISPTERSLRQKILDFTYNKERFWQDFQRALSLFFGEEVLRTKKLETTESEPAAFQEWYIFDYVTYEGERIIDLFAQEKGPILSPDEAQMLGGWRQSDRYRLFEVLDVHPGRGVTVQDLISGEVLDIHDRSTSRQVQRWAVLLVRTLLVEGELGFTGSALLLPPDRKAGLLDFAQDLWRQYQTRHRDANSSDFYRDHGLDFLHYVNELAKAPLPKIVTPEGHELVFARARFAVTDAKAIADRLNAAEEVDFAGPDEEHPEALHYNWLERGRSQGPEGLRSKLGGLLGRQRKEVGGEPEQDSYRSLGGVVLWPNRLELECMSRERLATGKALLTQILGNLITHRGDTFETVEQAMSKPEKRPRRKSPTPEIPPAVVADLIQKELDKHYATWPDIPLPALGGKTPRQAVRTSEGQKQVAEILKQIEYVEESKRLRGEPYYDVNRLRRELGL